MRVCEEQERRSERGSGIGKRYEEGGTNRETAIRKGDVEREREREGWKNGREANMRKCSGWFCPCGAEELFFPLALFLPFLGAPFTSSLSSRSPFLCPLRLLSLSMCYLSLLPSVHLSDPISTRLSMASALCFPPPIVFSLCSPRMHLFKSCFTKTVLKQTGCHYDGGFYLL